MYRNIRSVDMDAKSWALLFFLTAPQVLYFLPLGHLLSFAFGLLVFFYALIKGCIKFEYGVPQIIFLLIFISFLVLGVVLFFFGEQSEARSVAFYFLLQVFLIFLTFNFCSLYDQGRFCFVLSVVCFIEIVIIFGQYLNITYGFGFPMRGGEEGFLNLITGSLGNPNNSAAMLGLFVMTITVILTVQGRYFIAYSLLLVSLPPIFLTMSRTIAMLWVLNLVSIFLTGNFASLRQVRLKRVLLNLLLVIFILVAVWYGYLVVSEIDSDIFVRSLVRLEALSNVQEDNSIGFRFVSHMRLLENLGGLGIGSFSDLHYDDFFNSEDPGLMKVNPHSYLVEMSFLFGYPGLLFSLALFLLLVIGIASNKHISVFLRGLIVIALLFVQAVPSSLLASVWFFVPFIFLSNLRIK